MRLVVDIDNTICKTENSDYENSTPIQERIEHFNKCFDNGDYIIYYTARGGHSGIDWTDLTKEQFKKWGVKYNELIMRKLSYDLWIDDKCINVEEYFNNEF